ncbi:hypothetical protein AAMO2058_001583300 [Amorphochlora amoebiformis]
MGAGVGSCGKNQTFKRARWGKVEIRRSVSSLPDYTSKRFRGKASKEERAKMGQWRLQQELINVEEAYLSKLRILQKCYQHPMEDIQSILGGVGIDGIFMNIDKIRRLHAQSIKALNKHRFGKSEKMAKSLLRAAKNFQEYTKYAEGLEAALWQLYYLLDQKIFQEFWREQVVEEAKLIPHGETVEGIFYYILLPVDHISDVVEIMADLVENTAKDSTEYKHICIAYGSIKMLHVRTKRYIPSIIQTVKKVVKRVRSYGLEPKRLVYASNKSRRYRGASEPTSRMRGSSESKEPRFRVALESKDEEASWSSTLGWISSFFTGTTEFEVTTPKVFKVPLLNLDFDTEKRLEYLDTKHVDIYEQGVPREPTRPSKKLSYQAA